MIPSWLSALSTLYPVLLIISVVAIYFGITRLKKHIENEREEKEMEERKRQEFLSKMKIKLR